jgi:hypothetical protein
MAPSVKHTFVSPIPDGGDPTIVGPNAWNADHALVGVQGTIALTTTGTSGASTFDGTTLNIPNYAPGGSGTVTTVSIVSANGLAGTVANPTTSPAITLSTTVTGLLKGDGTSISAATPGADYQPASANLTSWAAITRASGFDTWTATPSSANLRALLTDETGTGLAYFQGGDIGTPSAGVATNLTGTAAGLTAGHVTTNANLTGPVTSVGNATAFAPSTLGYSLIGNGAGAPTYQGFLQPGASAVTRTWNAKGTDVLSVLDFGATGNTIIQSAAASITSGTAALTVAGASFTSADVGKSIIVTGAGAAGAALVTSILSFTSGTQVTLNANAGTTLTASTQTVAYGTNDTTAIQAAITAAVASGAAVYIPRGQYTITTALSVTAAIKIYGDGPYESVITPIPSVSGIAIAINNSPKYYGPTLEDFGISYPAQALAGSDGAITATSASFEVNGSYYKNLHINQAFNGIHFIKASWWVVDGCAINDSGQTAVFIENQNNADSGDGTIVNCSIFNPFVSGTAIGIIWRTGGGLRVENNKINFFQTGIQVQLGSGAATGDILINNNSIEAYGFPSVGTAINVFRLGATGTLHSLLIQGNQIGGFLNGITVPVDANGAWLENLVINDNELIALSTGSPTEIVVASTTGFSICGNVIWNNNNTATVAITTGSAATNGVVGPNVKNGTFAADSILSTASVTLVGQTPGVLGPEQVTILSADNTAPTNVNTAQNVFPTGQGTLTVQGATTYEFEAFYEIDTTGATSNTLQTLFGGTATFTAISYYSISTNGTASTTPATASMRNINVATASAVTAAVAAATQRQIKLRGTMRINAAGTVIPQFQYSAAPGAAPVVKIGSFFRCWPVGSNTVTSVGAWT